VFISIFVLKVLFILVAEAVEGRFFLRLTDDQMRSMGLKMGHVFKLKSFQEEAKVTFIPDVNGGETTTAKPVTLQLMSTSQSVASHVASASAAPKEVDDSSGIPSSNAVFEFVDCFTDSYGSPPIGSSSYNAQDNSSPPAGSSSYNAQDSSPAQSNSSNSSIPPVFTKYSSK